MFRFIVASCRQFLVPHRRFTFVLSISVFLFFCIGCKNRHTISPDTLRPASGGRYYGGEFRVNENGELRSLDPVGVNDVTSAHLSENIYDQLLYFDENLNLTNELAQRWEVSEDGLWYTYHIRKGVLFHDNPCFPGGKGRELTAYDVLYSYNRVCDARSGTLGSEFFRNKVVGAEEYFQATRESNRTGAAPSLAGVQGFSAPDDSTFRIQLTKAFGPFAYMAALNNTGIVPHEAVEKYGKDFQYHPVGTGPFTFVHWIPDRECYLVRNQKYWKDDEFGNRLPYLDAIRTTFIKDDKVQLLEFREGNLEESYRISNEFFLNIVDEKKELRGEYQAYKLYRVPALSTQYYGMMTLSPIFKDKRVRQAFSCAVDRDRIVRYVLKGQANAPAVHGLVPPCMPGYPSSRVKGYDFNVQKARQLLAEAGYPGGKGFPDLILQLNAGGGRNTAIAEAVQTMLAENLGITVRIQFVEFAKHLDEIDYGRAAFYRLGWVADYPDPESFLSLFYGKVVPPTLSEPSSQNGTRYNNPAFDEIFEKARATADRDQRNELYLQAEQIAVNDAPMLFIIYDEDYRLVQSYVEGYKNNAMDKRPYVYVWFNRETILKSQNPSAQK